MDSDDDDFYYFSRHDYMYDTDDSGPNYDDDYYDDYEEYYDSDAEARIIRKMAKLKAQKESNVVFVPDIHQCKSLVDICSKHLALNFPFAYLQDRFPPVPDDLQLRVISFSFPDNEEKIRKYAEFSRSDADIMYPSRLCDTGKVTEMMQIGFRLSANADGKYVTIHFDRGKITSAQCTCGSTTSWCTHVIATAIMRIRHAGKLSKSQIRLPVSDALNALSREQLLKFSHYLLYHHQNHKIVETAQGLIDKLVNRHGDYTDEEINVVHGAPDPTAGPGLDEECHWFVCSKGFKENCTNLIYEALDTLGFASLEYREENYHLHELWYKNRCQQPLVKDDIDMEIGSEFHSAYLLERRHDSSKILETVLDLLKDDTMSGFVAIKSCTEQLLSRFEKNKLHRSNYSRNSHTQVTNRPFYPSGSPAMGFTSRPFRSWMLCDELSRLWQVAVLNPKLKLKEQEQVVQELFKWNNEAHAGCSVEKLKPWKGLEVAYNLCQHIKWYKPEMQSILQGPIPADYSISGCTLVNINVEGATVQCHLPYCFSYGSTTLDIHSWCSIIHALDVYNYGTPAVNIALCLSVALITLYRYHVDTRSCISDTPIVAKCTLEHDDPKETADTYMDVDEVADQEGSCPTIWPSDTLLSLRCFAFLHNILWSRERTADLESLIATQRQRDPSGTTERGAILSNISDSKSLLFQLGALGLFLPKFPMATMKQEVEQFDLENWLTFQLLESKPTTSSDLELLAHLCKVAQHVKPSWQLAPSSSFTRVVLHHTYKELCLVREDVFELTLQDLDFSLHQDLRACPWTLFEFSNAVSWCKLAELCLSILVNENVLHMERALKTILSYNGVLGQGVLKLRMSSEEGHRNRYLLRSTLDGKSRICFVLAKALFARVKKSTSKKCHNHNKFVSIREIFTGVTNRALEVFPKVDCPSHIMALKKCAIRIGAHSVFLEKTSDRSYSHGSAVRWLIESSVECSLWGIRCLISSHPDINDLLQHEEAINLCKHILKENWSLQHDPSQEKKDDARVNLVKEVLMSLLRQAVNTDAVEKIKDILLTCREHNRSVCHVLTPWACQHICDMARTMTVHCEPLMFASEELFKCYKEKLNQTILENQRVNNLEGSLGLNRLFSEGHEEDNEAEPCKPCTPLNPYSTHTPHPFLELSFDLGIMGLNAVSKEDNAELRRCHAGRYNRGKKEHLKQLCDLVCYITTRKWLNQTPHDQIPIDVERRDRIPPLADSPQETDESYLTRFVTDLLESDASPMLLMSLLCEMTHKLRVIDDTKRFEDNHNTKQELLRHVLSLVPNLRLMMERIKSKFRNLLLGPKVNDLVKKITERRRRESNDLRADFEYQQLEDETFRDTLMAAKDAYEVGDPSGVSFKKLADEMEKQHKELKAVLEGVLSGEEFSRPRDEEVFRNNPFFFWPFITQELPFIRRHPLEDWLN